MKKEDSKRNKTAISNSNSLEELADFWDSHDLTDYWEQTEDAIFDVSIDVKKIFFALDFKLAENLRKQSKKRGISSDTYLNLIVQKALSSEHGS